MGLDGNAPRQRRGPEDAPRAEDTEEESKQADAQAPLIARFRTTGANLIAQIAERTAVLITVGGEDTGAEKRSLQQSIAIWAKAAALILSVGFLIGFLGSTDGLRGTVASSTAVSMMGNGTAAAVDGPAIEVGEAEEEANVMFAATERDTADGVAALRSLKLIVIEKARPPAGLRAY